jgi:hypothetical protein
VTSPTAEVDPPALVKRSSVVSRKSELFVPAFRPCRASRFVPLLSRCRNGVKSNVSKAIASDSFRAEGASEAQLTLVGTLFDATSTPLIHAMKPSSNFSFICNWEIAAVFVTTNGWRTNRPCALLSMAPWRSVTKCGR